MEIIRTFFRVSGVARLVKKALAGVSLELNELGFSDEVSERDAYINPDSIRTSIYQTKHGVLHIGAHRGQEAELYDQAGTKVLWVEAIEEIFNDLLIKIEAFPKQSAMLALLGDREEIVEFHISSNDGESSSVHAFAEGHGPSIVRKTSKDLLMTRLDSLISADDAASYAHWVVDVQGSELAVLIGAGKLLDTCFSLDVEVTTFDLYRGGTRFSELDQFLRAEGFTALWEPQAHSHQDLLYMRVGNSV